MGAEDGTGSGTGSFHLTTPRFTDRMPVRLDAKKTRDVSPKVHTRLHNHSQTPMAFNARVLAPWEPVSVDFNTIDEYCDWYNTITGEDLVVPMQEWLSAWMTIARQFDTLWLNDESYPCPAENAEIQLTRNG